MTDVTEALAWLDRALARVGDECRALPDEMEVPDFLSDLDSWLRECRAALRSPLDAPAPSEAPRLFTANVRAAFDSLDAALTKDFVYLDSDSAAARIELGKCVGRLLDHQECMSVALPSGGSPDVTPAAPWVVWSHEHDAWWGPNHRGYFADLLMAGTYAEADAKEIERRANDHGDTTRKHVGKVWEHAMPLESAWLFAPAARGSKRIVDNTVLVHVRAALSASVPSRTATPAIRVLFIEAEQAMQRLARFAVGEDRRTLDELRLCVTNIERAVLESPRTATSAPDLEKLLIKAMQDAWNDYCTDTGCFPEFLSVTGRGAKMRIEADFRGSPFARWVAERLVANDVAFAARVSGESATTPAETERR